MNRTARIMLTGALAIVSTAAMAGAAPQYARTARTGHVNVYFYKTSTAFCAPHRGKNMSRVTNNVALQIIKYKTVSCGSRSAALVKVNVVEGIHAGETGYMLKTDITPAPDLAH